MPENEEKAMLQRLSLEQKKFFSVGASFSTYACAGLVHLTWWRLASLSEWCEDDLAGLVLSFLIVLAYAFVIPEPEGTIGVPEDAEEKGIRGLIRWWLSKFPSLRVTLAEGIFTFFNTFIVFSLVQAFRAFCIWQAGQVAAE